VVIRKTMKTAEFKYCFLFLFRKLRQKLKMIITQYTNCVVKAYRLQTVKLHKY